MMSDSLSIDAVHNAHYGGDKVRYVQVFAYPRSAPQINIIQQQIRILILLIVLLFDLGATTQL